MLKNNIKVSIITVSYNAVNTIEQTILSVLNQSYKNIEYIIIDGKSADGTSAVIDRYAKAVASFVSEPDNGIYDAMNKGIRKATGDIIGILNSDDWYESDAVDKVVECFRNTDAELVYGNICYILDNGEKRCSVRMPLNQIWHTMVIPHPSVFVRRDIYTRYGLFNIRYKISADYELLLRFYTKGVRFEYIDAMITNFRNGGVSTTNILECAMESRQIRLSYSGLCPEEKNLQEKIETRYKETVFSEIIKNEPEILSSLFKHRYPDAIKNGIIIFGSGIWGEKLYYALKASGIPIKAFVDSAREKWNREIENIRIMPPTELKSYRGYVLIAARKYVEDICQQLFEMNNDELQWITIDEIQDLILEVEL